MSKDFKITNEINKSNGEIKTLLLKEIREYVSIRSYVINTIVGPILSLVFTITLSKQMLNGLEGLLPEGTLNVSLESFVFGFIVMISTFFLFLTNTSASSISLEGKNFWIIKSAPVKTSSVFMSKILLNMMIVGPFAVANVVISAVLTKANLIYAILALLMMLCIVGYFSTLGLYVNILLPKFDYDSPVKVIKQSMSALIVTGMAFVISIILISCYTVFGNMISPIVGIIICFAISLALLITSIKLLSLVNKTLLFLLIFLFTFSEITSPVLASLIEYIALKSRASLLPNPAETLPKALSAFFVMILITPPVASLP